MSVVAEKLAPHATATLRPLPHIRKAAERGQADHGWLKSAHTFSFAGYHDPDHMHFHALRVINDDRVTSGGGFPMHPHRNAEIFSYVLNGALEHRDTLGNGSIVKAGGVQFMSAGSGVMHSEFNPSPHMPVHFLQVWLIPEREDTAPRYDTLDITPRDKAGKLKLFLSGDGRGGSLRLNQNADVYAATLHGEQKIDFELRPGRAAWAQVARGALTLNGTALAAGDGAALEAPGALHFESGANAEFLLFDLVSS